MSGEDFLGARRQALLLEDSPNGPKNFSGTDSLPAQQMSPEEGGLKMKFPIFELKIVFRVILGAEFE